MQSICRFYVARSLSEFHPSGGALLSIILSLTLSLFNSKDFDNASNLAACASLTC